MADLRPRQPGKALATRTSRRGGDAQVVGAHRPAGLRDVVAGAVEDAGAVGVDGGGVEALGGEGGGGRRGG